MPFKNYACFSIKIDEVNSKDGKFEAKGLIVSKNEADTTPVIVKGKDVLTKYFKVGETKVVHGELGYNEFTRHSGEKVRQLIVRASRINNPDADGRLRNFVNLTVKAGKDGEASMGKTTGNAWAQLRAFKGMGKKLNGEYRPSLWVALKAFTTKEGDETLPYALGAIAKGTFVEVSGSLTSEDYNGQRYYSVIVRKLDENPDLSPVAAENASGAEETEPEAETA